MKYTNTKRMTAFLTLITMLLFTACGSTGTSSNTQLVDGSVQGKAPYVVEAHQGSTAVVQASGDHTGTHSWTQVSGPTVTLTGTSTPTVTHTVPTNTTTPIVLQHTTTHPQTGVTTVTPHTVVPIAVPNPTPTPNTPLVVIVGKPQVVFSGDVASLHASAYGGTQPYTYDWIAPANINLDTTHGTAPKFTVPALTSTQTIQIGLQVMDANGQTISTNESITMTQKNLIINPKTANKTVNSNHSKSASGPHPVSSLSFKITNAISSEAYSWTVKETANNNLPLVDLKMKSSNVTTTTSYRVTFKSPDVPVSSTYTLIVQAQNSKGDRVGTASYTVTINP